MVIWIDAQLSPAIALWINQNFKDIQACSLRSLGLLDAGDLIIFNRAKLANAIIMSKDIDFIKLLNDWGPPPKIILISCGNTSNHKMREVLSKHLTTALTLLSEGNDMVEIKDGFRWPN